MSETINPHPETSYEPTPEGLGMALDEALSRHASAIVHNEAARGEAYGLTGGDELVLYPDPKNPRVSLRMAPVGADADTRRFPASLGLHVTYTGRKDPGIGTYRVHGNPGNRAVEQWKAHPELQSAIDPTQPIDSESYASLINILSRATPEKPTGRSKQVLRALGNLSRRGVDSKN